MGLDMYLYVSNYKVKHFDYQCDENNTSKNIGLAIMKQVGNERGKDNDKNTSKKTTSKIV